MIDRLHTQSVVLYRLEKGNGPPMDSGVVEVSLLESTGRIRSTGGNRNLQGLVDQFQATHELRISFAELSDRPQRARIDGQEFEVVSPGMDRSGTKRFLFFALKEPRDG